MGPQPSRNRRLIIATPCTSTIRAARRHSASRHRSHRDASTASLAGLTEELNAVWARGCCASMRMRSMLSAILRRASGRFSCQARSARSGVETGSAPPASCSSSAAACMRTRSRSAHEPGRLERPIADRSAARAVSTFTVLSRRRSLQGTIGSTPSFRIPMGIAPHIGENEVRSTVHRPRSPEPVCQDRPVSAVPSRRQRALRARSSVRGDTSLFRRLFLVYAGVLAVAVAALIFAPITVSVPVAPDGADRDPGRCCADAGRATACCFGERSTRWNGSRL